MVKTECRFVCTLKMANCNLSSPEMEIGLNEGRGRYDRWNYVRATSGNIENLNWPSEIALTVTKVCPPQGAWSTVLHLTACKTWTRTPYWSWSNFANCIQVQIEVSYITSTRVMELWSYSMRFKVRPALPPLPPDKYACKTLKYSRREWKAYPPQGSECAGTHCTKKCWIP